MSWEQRTQDIKIGDQVAYGARFLRDIGVFCGDLPQARGRVTGLVRVGNDVTLAEITWDLPELPSRVNVKNLVLASRLAFER